MAEIPLFDSDEVGQGLSQALGQHRETFGGRLGRPAEGPMFRTAPDGAILDRGGREIQPAPKATQPTGG